MTIKQFMRKIGYISEKNLINVAIEIYNKEDTNDAWDNDDFHYRAGNANAIDYICGRFGIDIVEIIKKRKEKSGSYG